MTPTEVARSYDEIAPRWATADFPRDNGIAPHERALTFIRHRGRALDVGCGGSGRIIELLLNCGFEVEGLDASTRMLDLARRRHPHVTFHHGDICTWDLPEQKYDLISAWDSVWHVPLALQETVLRKIAKALTTGGVYVFTTGGVDSPGEKRDAAMGPPMYYSTLGIPRTLEVLAEAGCICRHLEYDSPPELHCFLIAQRA